MTPSLNPAKSGKQPASSSDADATARPALGARAASLLYNSAWYPAFPFALLFSGNRRSQARRERTGLFDEAVPGREGARIWLHAASVGEIEAIRPIAIRLLELQPDAGLVVTTMTEAGREAALSRIPGAAACRLAPLDHPLAVRAFLNAMRPSLVLIAEAELWPNFFIQSRRFGARIALVNGRLSRRSLRRYRLMQPLWTYAIRCADLLLVQSEAEAERYLKLGARPDRIVVTGNTKFETPDSASEAQFHPALQEFVTGNLVLVAGSTGPGEEEQVAQAYADLQPRFAGLRLVLAPRHLERVAEIEQMLRGRQMPYVKATDLKAGTASGVAPILLLDTMGDLRPLYSYGTLAFVGGSLFEGRGGQNLGEPAAAGIPVLFGPYHQNQLEPAQMLLRRGGGRIVRNADEIAHIASQLLSDEALRYECGTQALESYQSLTGGAARTVAQLLPLMNSK